MGHVRGGAIARVELPAPPRSARRGSSLNGLLIARVAGLAVELGLPGEAPQLSPTGDRRTAPPLDRARGFKIPPDFLAGFLPIPCRRVAVIPSWCGAWRSRSGLRSCRASRRGLELARAIAAGAGEPQDRAMSEFSDTWKRRGEPGIPRRPPGEAASAGDVRRGCVPRRRRGAERASRHRPRQDPAGLAGRVPRPPHALSNPGRGILPAARARGPARAAPSRPRESPRASREAPSGRPAGFRSTSERE